MRKKATWIIPSLLATALLSLFLVLPTLAAPSAAVDGTIKLSGGASDLGLFYSDKTTFNIAKATVTDADFSTLRTGTARYTTNGTVTVFDINKTTSGTATDPLPIIAGEKAQTDKFSGDGSITTFALTKLGRDKDDDGALAIADVSAKVSGVAATVSSVTSGGAGTHIASVTLSAAPASGTDNVEISYEISDYDIATPGNTPLSLVGSSVKFGATFATATNTKAIAETNSTAGTITVISDIATANAVIVSFAYDVKDTATKLVTFSSASLASKGLTRKIDGVETLADSGKFEASVGLFSGSDFDKIVVAQLDARVTTIDGIEAFAGIVNTNLETRIEAAASVLGFATTVTTELDQSEGGSDDAFVALLVPVADGETLNVSFVDGTTTRSDTADIDIKAPTVVVVQPGSGSFINTLAKSFSAIVTDELSAGGKASGLAQGDANTLVVSATATGTNSATSLVPLLVASNSFQISRSFTFVSGDEGSVSWWIVTQDKVGNIPQFTDTRTAPQKAQGVANPAVQGAGDPATPTNPPGNPAKFTLDIAPPVPITNAVKTGGAMDTRLTVVPTGSHTGASDAASLEDNQASLITAGVAVDDKVTNLTDGSSCTITGRTATTVTCTLGGGINNDWDANDSYKIANPELGNVKVLATSKNTMHIEVDRGTGAAALDSGTVQPGDFNLIPETGKPAITVSSAVVDKRGNKVLLTLAADLGTADKPKLEITGEIKDKAGNKMATVTSTNAIAALDGLAPEIPTPTITGTALSRPASNGTVTIAFSSGEAASSTPTVTAAYLVVDDVAPFTLKESTPVNLTVSSTGVNAWQSTVTISTILGSSTAGLVNIRINIQDAAGNTAKAGLTDPDGTVAADAGKIKSGALVIEFDNRLNEGEKDLADIFVVSPNTGTTAAPKTDTDSPFITMNFDTTSGGGEDKEYSLVNTGGAVDPIEVDTHKGVTLTSAIWGFPDGTTKDVLASVNQADVNSYVFAPSGLAIGTHTFTLQAKDEVGNVSVSVGSTTPTSFVLTVIVTARVDYKVTVKPGFNLISVPAVPSEIDLNTVIDADSPIDFVMTYENSTGLFLVATRDTDPASATFGQLVGNLTTFDSRHAYWVQSDRFLDLKILIPRTSAGIAIFPTVIPVFGTAGPGEGWNLVPIGDPAQQAAGTDIDADEYFSGVKWSAAFTFDTVANAFTKIVPETAICAGLGAGLQPCLVVGAGYFVFVTADGVIIP